MVLGVREGIDTICLQTQNVSSVSSIKIYKQHGYIRVRVSIESLAISHLAAPIHRGNVRCVPYSYISNLITFSLQPLELATNT